MEVIMKPADCNARSADSRPEPGPVLGRHLRGIGGRLARALEAHQPGGRPRDRVPLRVGDGDHRVVEARIHMRYAGSYVLALTAAHAGCVFGHSFPSTANNEVAIANRKQDTLAAPCRF